MPVVDSDADGASDGDEAAAGTDLPMSPTAPTRSEDAAAAAAAAAAQCGASVTLLERYNHLGGLSTGGLVIWIDRMTDWSGQLVIRGFAEELFDRMPPGSVAGPDPADWGSTDVEKAAHWSFRTAAYHGIVTWSPTLDPERHTLTIHGLVDRPMSFTVDDIKRFPQITRTYFIECSGNGGAGYRDPKPDTTPQPLAGLFSTSEWTGVPLATLFREVAGDTWFNTVRALRLAHARRLLRETGRSVTSICYECGFEDVSNFYRAFRAAERASPDAWRRKLVAANPAQVPR